jgi:hypothetical protein
MTPRIHRIRGYVVRRASGGARVVVLRTLPQHPTTAPERFLLMATIILLPLQGNLPKLGEVSSLFIIFGVLGVFLVFCRPGVLARTLRHPMFLSGYALIGIALLMEVIHSSTGYDTILRYFYMFMGAVFITSLCRDRWALRSGMYGVMLASVWMAALLFLTVHGNLSLANTGSYSEATQLRGKAMDDNLLENNWNVMGFLIAEGAVVALALGLSTKTRLQQYVFLAIGAFCAVATFLPMSRSAIVALVVATTAIFYTQGVMRARVITGAVILVIIILLWVPAAVFSRLTITTQSTAGRYEDERTDIYKKIIEHLPEFVLTGVGVSHFYGDWGMDAGFRLVGTHNIYAQVTVYWGLPGLLALLALVWRAYQCLPRRSSAEPLSLCLLGIGVSVMVYTLFTHNLEDKPFSIALGLLAGANHWIWPRRLMYMRSVDIVADTLQRATRFEIIEAHDEEHHDAK